MLFPLIKFGEFQIDWLEFQFTLSFWLTLVGNIYIHIIPVFRNYSSFSMAEIVTQITTFYPQGYDREAYRWCCMNSSKPVPGGSMLPRIKYISLILEGNKWCFRSELRSYWSCSYFISKERSYQLFQCSTCTAKARTPVSLVNMLRPRSHFISW